MRPRENDKDAQTLVSREAVIGAGRHEGRLPFLDRNGLAFDREDPPTLEHEVELVVLVRLLAVRLRRDEDVDADLEPRRAVNDLVATVTGREALPDSLDLERTHVPSLTSAYRRSRR